MALSGAARQNVAILAVLFGIGFAAVDSVLNPPPRKGDNPRAAVRREYDLRVYEICVGFYGAIYLSGRAIYRAMGARQEEEELRSWSKWHMVVLNGFGGTSLFLVGGLAWAAGNGFRLTLLVAAGLLAVVVRDAVGGVSASPVPRSRSEEGEPSKDER